MVLFFRLKLMQSVTGIRRIFFARIRPELMLQNIITMQTNSQGRSAFMRVMIAFCVLSSLIFSACNTTDPIYYYNVKNLVVTGNLPGGTEGTPNTGYVFTADHSRLTVNHHYEWTFDDGTSESIRDSNRVHHVFKQNGLFAVMVRIINDDQKRELARATLVVNIRSQIPNIPMLLIPAGNFYMGSNRGVDQSEQPLHTTQITSAFRMGLHEVLQSEWDAIMPTNPSWFRGDSLPVENVSWYEAIDFCNRLSIRCGLSPCYTIAGDSVTCFFTASGYRLPTEAEWEYCARAKTTTDFYSGNANNAFAGCLSGDTLDILVDSVAWYCMNSGGHSHQVGGKTPNAFGLYDMIGNVSEWCWDWFGGNYYRAGVSVDPTGPINGTYRIVRGGSFEHGVIDCRVSCRRLSENPSARTYSLGFRVVRRGS